MSKPIHISYSSVQRFHECSEKYWLSKEWELAGPTPSSLVFGTTVEKGVEALLLGKDLQTAIQIFDDAWNKMPYDLEYLKSDFDPAIILPETVKECELPEDWLAQTELDQGLYNQMAWLCCLIRGQVLIKGFHDYILPDLELHVVDGKPCTQIPVRIESAEGDKLVGFMDFVVKHKQFKELLIIDLKTSAKAYSDDQIDKSEQLRTYLASNGHVYNTNRAGYVVLVKKLVKVKTCSACGEKPPSNQFKICKKCEGKITVSSLDAEVQFVTKEFKEYELQEQLDSYAETITRIKSGEREMNKESCFAFGRKCEFYDYCHAAKPLAELETIRPKAKKALTQPEPSDKKE